MDNQNTPAPVEPSLLDVALELRNAALHLES